MGYQTLHLCPIALQLSDLLLESCISVLPLHAFHAHWYLLIPLFQLLSQVSALRIQFLSVLINLSDLTVQDLEFHFERLLFCLKGGFVDCLQLPEDLGHVELVLLLLLL